MFHTRVEQYRKELTIRSDSGVLDADQILATSETRGVQELTSKTGREDTGALLVEAGEREAGKKDFGEREAGRQA